MKVAENSMNHRHGEAAFGLIELMVGVLIIAISVIALYEMFIQGTQMLTEERHRGKAVELAVARMENLKSFHVICDTIPMRYAGRFEEYIVPEDGEEQPLVAYCTVTITRSRSRQANGMFNYSRVSVEYVWTERDTGRSQKVEFQSNF
jgi:hypothetical protein